MTLLYFSESLTVLLTQENINVAITFLPNKFSALTGSS